MNKLVSIYEPSKHKDQLIKWYKQWGWSLEILEMMPTTGLIVEGVCACFIYETNSNICFIESLISDRDVSSEEKDEYLDKMLEVVFHMAKEKGFKYIKGDTRYPKVEERAVKHGFKVAPYNYHAFFRSL